MHQGIQPSWTSRSSGGSDTWLGLDREPLRHSTGDLSSKKDRWHLSQPMSWWIGVKPAFCLQQWQLFLFLLMCWRSEGASLNCMDTLLICLVLLSLMLPVACSHLGATAWWCTRVEPICGKIHFVGAVFKTTSSHVKAGCRFPMASDWCSPDRGRSWCLNLNVSAIIHYSS